MSTINRELKEKCLQRWGCIPTDTEWVQTAMEGWIPDTDIGHVTGSEILRKEQARHYLALQGIEYI